MKRPALSVVIPARGVGDTIREVFTDIEKKVKTPHEIIVVVDRVKGDETHTHALRFAATHKHVFVLVRSDRVKASFARALALGIKKAKAPFVVPVMADACDDPASIDLMYNKATQGWDIVCASRYMSGGVKRGGPLVQSVMSRMTCWVIHIITGIPTTDVSNSFKLYRKDMLSRVHIDMTGGTETSMDITIQSYAKGAAIVDVPTVWNGGKPTGSELRIFRRTGRYGRVIWRALGVRFFS